MAQPRGPGSLPFPDRPAGSDCLPGIDHIVVLMKENHSYDSYFGMLERGDGFTLGAGGSPLNSNPDRRGQQVRVHHLSLPVPCQNSHTGSELVFSAVARLLSSTR